MYRRASEGWLKHIDFVILDLFCAELAFFLGFYLRHRKFLLNSPYYVRVALLLLISELLVSAFFHTYRGVLHRGAGKEFAVVLQQVSTVSIMLIVLLYLLKLVTPLSRLTFVYMWLIYLALDFVGRLILKRVVLNRMMQSPSRSVILLTTSTRAEKTVKMFQDNRQYGFRVAGLILYDRDGKGEAFDYVPVVASLEDAEEYICRNWIDELFADLPEGISVPGRLFQACMSMGVTVHQRLPHESHVAGEQFVESIAGCTVITTAIKTISWQQAMCKRLMDIVGGLIGVAITLLLTVVIGPMIVIRSPGPIFFKQVRIGQNGRKFKLYKFRSMYMDAEERKKELMEQNKIKDGYMFKMDNDPRVIKGIGHFIRNHSLDEFPQFFNVLIGNMSLVGTRPPTVDEWEKYELHHRVRMSAKPGLTGMWQVSGRSEITDFEEVVRLDEEYIRNWSMLLDIKIILKTVAVMFTKDGAA